MPDVESFCEKLLTGKKEKLGFYKALCEVDLCDFLLCLFETLKHHKIVPGGE